MPDRRFAARAQRSSRTSFPFYLDMEGGGSYNPAHFFTEPIGGQDSHNNRLLPDKQSQGVSPMGVRNQLLEGGDAWGGRRRSNPQSSPESNSIEEKARNIREAPPVSDGGVGSTAIL